MHVACGNPLPCLVAKIPKTKESQSEISLHMQGQASGVSGALDISGLLASRSMGIAALGT